MDNFTKTIIDKYFKNDCNNLTIGGVSVLDIAEKHGTPVFVYDLDGIKAHYQNICASADNQIEIFYSIKANPNFDICRILAQCGSGAEVASGGELTKALRAGFHPKKIVFAGPGKDRRELEIAAKSNILSINVESIQEIQNLNAICAHPGRTVDVCLRINPSENNTGAHQVMGGVPSQFGIDQEELLYAFSILEELKMLNPIGIHVYIGNQILDAQKLIQNVQNITEIAKKTKSDFKKIQLRIVNFGGGWGVGYHEKAGELDFVVFSDYLKEYIDELKNTELFKNTRFICEPGRYLTAQFGIFISRVLYTKNSKGKKFAILDGGMNCNAIATSNFGHRFRRNYPLCIVNRISQPNHELTTICGRLCTPMDVFARDLSVPSIEPGDIVAVFLSGAYGFSGSPHFFLSHEQCKEIVVSQGESYQSGENRK
jgi:diaminopimelate decarboxylase